MSLALEHSFSNGISIDNFVLLVIRWEKPREAFQNVNKTNMAFKGPKFC